MFYSGSSWGSGCTTNTISTAVTTGCFSSSNIPEFKVTSSGSISVAAGIAYENQSTGNIVTFQNDGIISGANAGVSNTINATIGTLINNNKITAASIGSYALNNAGSIGEINNNLGGVISGSNGGNGSGIYNSGIISNLNNSGAIGGLVGNIGGITNDIGGLISNLVNFSSGTITGNGDIGVQSFGTISSLVNYGVITGVNAGIDNESSLLALTNLGSITSSTNGIFNQGLISTFTNAGVISGGVFNGGSITVLNNLQGQGNAPLLLSANLPSIYNIIINGQNSYGQLQVSSVSGGPMTFGVYGGGVSGVAGSSLSKGTYSSVLSGVAANNLNNTSGNYKGFTWLLSETSIVDGIWNLLVTGASTVDTQQSLFNSSQALMSTFGLQNSVLASSFSHDCVLFDKNNFCFSAGGRNTAIQVANGFDNSSTLIIAAYRPHPNYRIGTYVDQNLSVNISDPTVTLGNNMPLIGLFGAWNENLDGTGAEVKVSVAFGQKNIRVTRQVVGTSESGSGSTQLSSLGGQVNAKYGFAVFPQVIVSPYVGLRYAQNNMGGYTEAASSTLTAPLTFDTLDTNAITALVGIKASYQFIPTAMVFASLGLETDTSNSNGTYSATGVSGLTPISFNANPVKTRSTATVGAYYDIVKNQRLGVTGIYRQEPYQSMSTKTVMATYTLGF